MELSAREGLSCEEIAAKMAKLGAFFAESSAKPADPVQWYEYLSGLKAILGNLNNDVSYVATLMAKEFLSRRLDMGGFDAASKAQGAPGLDIDYKTPQGVPIAAEIKTTFPYMRNFGAQQRNMLAKDLDKLRRADADLKFMFVTERLAFDAIKRVFGGTGEGVTVVLLPSGEEYKL